jgi:hypothetical protein
VDVFSFRERRVAARVLTDVSQFDVDALEVLEHNGHVGHNLDSHFSFAPLAKAFELETAENLFSS